MADGYNSRWFVEDKLEAILKIWRHITFDGNKSENPFGVEKAEDNVLGTLKVFYSKLPAFLEIEQLSTRSPVLVFGSSGVGKTAMIFQLMYTALGGRGNTLDMGFPVYLPVFKNPPSIRVMTKAIADTLIAYFAHKPDEFRESQEQNRQSIVHLWVKFVGGIDDIILALREAGLPIKGLGAEMEKEIRERMNGVSNSSAWSDTQCLDALRRCCPGHWRSIQVFLDWQSQKPPYNMVENLLKNMKELSPSKVYVTVFWAHIPDGINTILTSYPQVRYMELTWRDKPEHLKGFLQARLKNCGEDSITSWCDPEAKVMSPGPDDQLINASNGNPSELIRRGNLIFNKWISKKSKLSLQDLYELLGSEKLS
jgi:hypothetical protein